MDRKRVVVTGMGAISPVGCTVNEFWQNAIQGKSGVKLIDYFDVPDGMSRIAGMVNDFFPESASIFNTYEGHDRAVLFAREAVLEALNQSQLNISQVQSNNSVCSLVLSSAVSAISSMERHIYQATDKGINRIENSSLSPKHDFFSFNYITDVIAQHLAINGRSLLIPTGCAGCLDAIAYSVNAIRQGYSDVIITGASEAPITPLVVSAFNKIGATSKNFNHMPTKASRPYDRYRDGFVLGEGCGILILESLEHAEMRNAPIYAEISGVGSVNNCYHMTNIPEDGESISLACVQAIQDTNNGVNGIDHINAHGSSTPQNDVAETRAVKKIFNGHCKKISVTSNKSFLGHALAASNALETILSIQSINNNLIPPTINLEHQDKLCDLNIVANVAREQNINRILKMSSGFSGIHTALVIDRYSDMVA